MSEPRKDIRLRAAHNVQHTAETLSEMLAHTVTEARRLQKQQEKALGRRFATQQELAASYDTRTMKELTAILKDITAVVNALTDGDGQQGPATGVVLLPPVTQGPADTIADEETEGLSDAQRAENENKQRGAAQ